MSSTCPNCGVDVVIESTLRTKDGRVARPKDSPIGVEARNAVRAFMAWTNLREAAISELYNAYCHRAMAQGWPEITKNGLARLLTDEGAKKHRTARARLYTLPVRDEVLSPEPTPRPWAPSVIPRVTGEREKPLPAAPAEPVDYSKVKLPWE